MQVRLNLIGKTLAHYEVLDHLGAGGMGEVFRARDTKLGRDVALKMLPAAVASDPERLARFQREAQLLASLNHPNIASIYGVEEADGARFLVMELAEGEDLQRRLSGGALPLDECLAIARGIAEGLEEAHERGVVHRDLKPANVMVSSAGKVKVLDFGLARAYSGETADEGDPALSPTITAAMTQAGTVLGSAAYMSPEQAKGREVDRRTDIWAFGVILYEMIAGRRLFEGETVSDTMAAVLKDPIDVDALGPDVPVAVRSLLLRCLERDPMQRLRDIGEARIHLDPSAATRLLSGSAPDLEATESQATTRPLLPWALFAVAAAAALWFAFAPRDPAESQGSVERPVVHAALEAPEGANFHLSGANPGAGTVSPDGTRVMYTARDEAGQRNLWIQDLQHHTAERIQGTDDAQYPFWSPDGRSVAYHTATELRVIDLAARTNRALHEATNGKGGTWLEDDTILFAQSSTSPIYRLDLASGESEVLTDLAAEPSSNSHRHPRSLGDGRHYVFAARTHAHASGPPVAIMYADLETGDVRELTRADGQAEYANGHLFYTIDGKVFARPFLASIGEFTGPPVLIVEGVGLLPGAALSLFSVSPAGTLSFHPGGLSSLLNHLTWYSIDGEPLGTMGEPTGLGRFDVSPDGDRVVFTSYANRLGAGDLYLHTVESNVRTRLSFDPASEESPIWSPDGQTIYYGWSDLDTEEIRAFNPDGRDDPRVIHEVSQLESVDDVSPDGKWLAYTIGGSGAYLLPLDGGSPIRIDDSVEQSGRVRFSPDGRWLAYVVGTGQNWRLHVKTNPPGSRKWEVTETPVYWFDWHPDGTRIFHQYGNASLSVTELDMAGESPVVGATSEQIEAFPAPLNTSHTFRISPDAERVLVHEGNTLSDDRPLRIVLGWDQIVRRATR